MDFWGALTLFFFIFLILSCCGYCCSSKQRGVILSTPVVVTSATHTAPGGYPVTQMPPGAVPASVYAPYPAGQQNMTATNIQMPMSQPAGFQQQTTPYPPYPPMGGQPPVANMSPPSYEAAVSGVGVGHLNTGSTYEKQAPYNPSYSQ